MSAVTIDNDLVHYEVLGRGRPVVFLHGWLGSWRYWVPVMQQLSMKYRTYALDLWGYGDSSKDPEKLSLDAHVELIGNFLDKLGIPKAAFVGHSLGAAVMIRFAMKYPGRVARLMVINSPVFEGGSLADLPPESSGAAELPPKPPVSAPTRMARPAGLDQRLTDLANQAAEAPAGDPTVFRRPQDLNRRLTDPMPLPEFDIKPGEPLPKLADLAPPPVVENPPVETLEVDTTNNLLRTILMNQNPQTLLATHLERDVPDYDRCLAEAAKIAPAAFSVGAVSFDKVDLIHDIRRVSSPTFMVHGDSNEFLPPPSTDLMTYLAYNNADFRCELIPAGHFPMLTDPTNFHRLLTGFLETRNLADIQLGKDTWKRKLR